MSPRKTKKSTKPSTNTSKAGPKRKTTAKKAKKTSGEASDDDGEFAAVTVDWLKDNQNMSWKLIAAITDNEPIKQGLFPSSGANVSTAKGGGKSKTECYQQLCDELFGNRPEYMTAWLAVKNAKGKGATKKRTTWGNKIKNRLQAMQDETKLYLEATDTDWCRNNVR